MGREAISIARVTEACRSEAKVLVPVVLVWGAARAAAVDVIETELVLKESPPAKYQTGPFSLYHRPSSP
jgi:hypothetical protein